MDDNDKKGFAGFDALLSDVDLDKILNDKNEPSHPSVSAPASSPPHEPVGGQDGVSDGHSETIYISKNSAVKKAAQIVLLFIIGFLSLALLGTFVSNGADLGKQCASIKAGTYYEVERNFSSPQSQLYRCVQEGLIEKRNAQISNDNVQDSDLQNLNSDAFEQGKNLETYNIWYATQDIFGIKVSNTGSQALTDFIFSFQNGSCKSNTAEKRFIHIRSEPIQPNEITVLNWPKTLDIDKIGCLIFLAGYGANAIGRPNDGQVSNSLPQIEPVSPEIKTHQPELSQAASFDCKQAKSTLEILICADPELAALDGQVGRAYTNSRNIVGDDSNLKSELLGDQREFLKGRLESCSVPYESNLSDKEAQSIIACLKIQYQDRLETLQQKMLPQIHENNPTGLDLNDRMIVAAGVQHFFDVMDKNGAIGVSIFTDDCYKDSVSPASTQNLMFCIAFDATASAVIPAIEEDNNLPMTPHFENSVYQSRVRKSLKQVGIADPYDQAKVIKGMEFEASIALKAIVNKMNKEQ